MAVHQRATVSINYAASPPGGHRRGSVASGARPIFYLLVMMDGEGPDSSDPDPEKYLIRLSHRGRTVRMLIALVLTPLALVPVPYIGWGYGIVLLGPASALLAVAALDRKSRPMVLLWSIPTAVGIVLSLFSLAAYASHGVGIALFFQVIGIASLTTLIAALLGRTPSRT